MKYVMQKGEWRSELRDLIQYQDPELQPPCVGMYVGPGNAIEKEDDEGAPSDIDRRLKGITAGMEKALEWLRDESNRRKVKQPEADRNRRWDESHGEPKTGWWWSREWDHPADLQPHTFRPHQPESHVRSTPYACGHPLHEFVTSVVGQYEQVQHDPIELECFREANWKIISDIVSAGLVTHDMAVKLVIPTNAYNVNGNPPGGV